jgi:hypothetical protein
MDAVAENPAVAATEPWEMYNATDDAHPIHHEAAFEVIDRQKISVDEKAQKVRILAGSAPMPRDKPATKIRLLLILAR